MESKTCTGCKQTKPLDQFYAKRSDATRYRAKCKECHRIKYKADYALGLGNYRDYHLKKYWAGSTVAEAVENYERLFSAQKGVCKICKQEEVGKRLAVDHDHTTLKVRGLLCEDCNRALGLLRESFDIALQLAKYVQEHKDIV